MGSGKTGWLFLGSIAEAGFFHLLGGGGKAVGAGVVHGNETECLGERNAISADLEKFNLSVDPPKNRAQSYIAHSSVWNGTLGKNG